MKLHAPHHDGSPGPVAIKMPMVRVTNSIGTGFAALDPDIMAATEPCPTCHEFAALCAELGVPLGCPDCIGGKPRVELTWPCLLCEGRGGYPVGNKERVCPDCDAMGVVSAGVGTIKLVPVYDWAIDLPWPGDTDNDRIDFIVIGALKRAAWIIPDDDKGEGRPITLPPGAVPGDMVIVWTAEADR